MIIDKLKNYYLYEGQHHRIDKSIECIRNIDFTGALAGRHEIYGDKLFFNLIEYETTCEEEREWEAHKKYIDVHYILKGEEIIGYEQVDLLVIKGEYNVNDDYYTLKGDLTSKVKLQSGDFMVLYPDEAHKTAIKVEETNKVRKVVFKVLA